MGRPPKAKAPAFTPKPEDVAAARRSLTVRLNEDGSPDWSGVQAQTLEAWKTVFIHPSTSAVGIVSTNGAAAAAGPTPESVLAAAAVGPIFRGLSNIQGVILSRMFKLPLEDVLPLVAFSEKEIDELIPAATAVADKWARVAFEKWGAEIGLGFQLFSLEMAKYQSVKALAVSRGILPRKEIFDREAVQVQ